MTGELARQLKKGLDEQGHTVTVASDGTEGLEAAKYGEFDVLVLDVMLPGLDGFSIVRRLRAAGKATPILLSNSAGRGGRCRHWT